MTAADPIPDRAAIRQRAAKRIRVSMALLMVAVFGGLLAGMGIAAAGFTGEESSGGTDWMFLAVGAALIIVGIGALLLALRYRTRNPDILSGLDRPTRKAFGRALRDGRTDDPRIDALVRESAARHPGKRWPTWALVGIALFNVAPLVWRIQDEEWSGALISGSLVAMLIFLAAYREITARRMRAYVRQEGPAGTPDTAA